MAIRIVTPTPPKRCVRPKTRVACMAKIGVPVEIGENLRGSARFFVINFAYLAPRQANI